MVPCVLYPISGQDGVFVLAIARRILVELNTVEAALATLYPLLNFGCPAHPLHENAP